MIYNNIEFHNVDHLREIPGMSGLKIERFPENIQKSLGSDVHHRGRFFSERSIGCELRFVTDAMFFNIGLTAIELNTDITIYRGDFFHSKHTLIAGNSTVLHIEIPTGFDAIEEDAIIPERFPNNVWRILIGYSGYVFFNYLDLFGYSCRPPKSNEKPLLNWLAYGSSITYGGQATSYSNCYINQAALRLKANVFNKGIPGSCQCENSVADYLASLDFDIISLELGINMIDLFTPMEFEQRARYMLHKIIEKNPNKPLFVIGILPNKNLILKDKTSHSSIHCIKFNEITKALVNELGNSKTHYIDANRILTSYSFLSSDLVHPSDDGHIRMGGNLANEMIQYI
jgi:hypothetical protein